MLKTKPKMLSLGTFGHNGFSGWRSRRGRGQTFFCANGVKSIVGNLYLGGVYEFRIYRVKPRGPHHSVKVRITRIAPDSWGRYTNPYRRHYVKWGRSRRSNTIECRSTFLMIQRLFGKEEAYGGATLYVKVFPRKKV